MKLLARYRLVATAKTFMEAYELSTFKMDNGYRRLGTVEFYLSEQDGVIFIESIHQRGSKGLGYAGKAMKYICDLADVHNVELKLYVEPVKEDGKLNGLDFVQLFKWYKRLGFENTNQSYKIRKPK